MASGKSSAPKSQKRHKAAWYVKIHHKNYCPNKGNCRRMACDQDFHEERC